MALVTNTNVPSLNAQRNLTGTNRSLSKSLERLSSGLRINRAGDDAAGLAISEKLRAQVRGQQQAIRNANDGISLIQTAEGAFNVATNIIQRLRELAVQSASDSNTSADRATLKRESDELVAELTRLGNTTEFNGQTLLNGSFSSGKLHIGANYNQNISFSLNDVRAGALGRRTSVTGDLADSASSGINAGLTPGEVTVNGERVVTTSTDDQVSVLEITGIGATAVAIGSGELVINSVAIGAVASGADASAHAQALMSAINAASITNVTARLTFSGDGIILVSEKGTDIKIAFAGSAGGTLSAIASLYSAIGIATDFFSTGGGITTVNGQSSALAKAAAVNQVRSSTNVTAAAQETTVTGSSAIEAVSIANAELYINGVNIGAVTVAASDASGTLVAAINTKTSETGVTASVDTDGKLVLTAADGRNIAVSSSAASSLNIDTGLYRSSVQLNSVDTITIAGNASTATELGSGITATTYQPDLTNALNTIDLTTQTGADSAILSLDAALEQLNNNRSVLGALQNRLEFSVDNLATSAENLSASESRIRDADFALETAQFTRSQILMQAGTAILAQANTLPQLALQLLQ